MLKPKRVPINMRAPKRTVELIDVACGIAGSDRTSFILDAACAKAEEVILDSRHFELSNEAFDRFESALQANPMSGNVALQKLLARSEQ